MPLPSGWDGVLLVDGQIAAWFADALTSHDERTHGHAIGEDTGQQTWESLVVLVAVKCWGPQWKNHSTAITLQSDNMAALALAAKMNGKASKIISRELALAMSASSFAPRFVEHVPGVMNSISDALSRLTDPTKPYNIPEVLLGVRREIVPVRDENYFTTLQF